MLIFTYMQMYFTSGLLLWMVLLANATPLAAQQIIAPNRIVIGYLEEGKLISSARLPVATIKDDRIKLPNHKIVGRLRGNRILSPNQAVLAYFKDDRLLAPNHKILLYLKSDRLLKPNNGIAWYFKGISPRDAAICYFFFAETLKR